MPRILRELVGLTRRRIVGSSITKVIFTMLFCRMMSWMRTLIV